MTLQEFTNSKDIKEILIFLTTTYHTVMGVELTDGSIGMEVQNGDLRSITIASHATLRIDEDGISIYDELSLYAKLPLTICEQLFNKE